VHEAYLKLLQSPTLRCENKAHFVSIAARAMRQILVDHVRSRRAVRHGGPAAASRSSGSSTSPTPTSSIWSRSMTR
jgi:hypothetical protein